MKVKDSKSASTFRYFITPSYLTLAVFIITLSGFAFCQFSDGNYRIENVGDGLHLTIQGSNGSYASVVSDNWRNFAEQSWHLRKSGYNMYRIAPKKYESNNVLSYHFDIGRRYAQLVQWRLNPIPSKGHPIYQLVNDRTRECLTSFGRRCSVNETRCDQYVRYQQWKLHKLT